MVLTNISIKWLQFVYRPNKYSTLLTDCWQMPFSWNIDELQPATTIKCRNMIFKKPSVPQYSLLTPETSCGIQVLLFQSLSGTTNSSAFCHANLQPCEIVICLLFVLVSFQTRANTYIFYTRHLSDLSFFASVTLWRHLSFLSVCLTIQILVFALLQLLSLFSLLKVLLLLSSFSLSMLSVLLKAGLTDPLLSSAWRLISALPCSTVPMCLLRYKCLMWSLFYQSCSSWPFLPSSISKTEGVQGCGPQSWSDNVSSWLLPFQQAWQPFPLSLSRTCTSHLTGSPLGICGVPRKDGV